MNRKYTITPSSKKDKKYDVTFADGKTLSFGQKGYQQYRDSALGIYKEFDHLDKRRQDAYRKRFQKKINIKYSPAWFSNTYLWS